MAPRGELDMPKVGDAMKVHLPGESPWAICKGVYPDGTWEGEINNLTVAERSEEDRREIGEHFFPGSGHVMPKLHDFRCGQVVRFQREVDSSYEIWVPAESVVGTA